MDQDLPEPSRVSFIPCVTWVPKGVANTNPEKVEITKEELQKIIQDTKGNLEELEETEEEEYKNIKKEEEEEYENIKKEEEEAYENIKKEEEEKYAGGAAALGARIKASRVKGDGEAEGVESRYKLTDYDEEQDKDNLDELLKLGMLTMYSCNDDDPYVTIKDDADDDSEAENHQILPTDNLIAVGHVDGDAAILEVYVYNPDEGSLYVHHDVLLSSPPLCLEWLNYDAADEELKPANMAAIGSMSPVIEVWDLDLIDALEPAYTLGKKGKKKKKLPGVGHKDAVLTLAWNRHAEHVLASGSVDQTVILWDLQNGTVAQQIKSFKEKVQSIRWHPNEPHTLLTGSCDKNVKIYDCRTSDTSKTWKLDGEVECVVWQQAFKGPLTCLASTDQGTVFAIDPRVEKPLWTLRAHTDACTGVQLSPQCPGCMVTVSSDMSVKVWDIGEGKPSFIEETEPRLGVIQCLAACPDYPFVFCMGGDNKENNFKVWDIRESKNVRSRFCSRVGLPADVEEEEMEVPTEDAETAGASAARLSASQNSGWKPKTKFQKRKGGHLDWKRRK